MRENVRELNQRLERRNNDRPGGRMGGAQGSNDADSMYEWDSEGIVTGIPWFLITAESEKQNVQVGLKEDKTNTKKKRASSKTNIKSLQPPDPCSEEHVLLNMNQALYLVDERNQKFVAGQVHSAKVLFDDNQASSESWESCSDSNNSNSLKD